MQRELKNNLGFGMIETLIVLGLLAVMGIGTAVFMTQMNSDVKGLEAKSEQRDITTNIRSLLRDPSACFNTFNGRQVNAPLSLPGIKNNQDQFEFKVDDLDQTKKLIYAGFETTAFKSTSADGLKGIFVIKIKLNRSSSAKGSVSLKPDYVTIKADVDTTFNVLKCQSLGLEQESSGYWLPSPGTRNIYYTGNVGVGTVDPVAPLDVSGAVQFGNTGSDCNSRTEGQQRNNPGTHKMEFCNGSIWQAYKLEKPANCIGVFSPCDENCEKTYQVIKPAEPGGTSCAPNKTGDKTKVGCTQTAACGGTGTPDPSLCRKLGCFIAGTKISMADGSLKNIEDVKAGDLVLSFDEGSQSQRIDVVEKPLIHAPEIQRLHHFLMSDGTLVTSNEEHPYFVIEKDNWIRTADIYKLYLSGEPISFLNQKNEILKVKNIILESKFVPVYNLAIKGISKYDDKYGAWGRGHNYYANGVLVHNKYDAFPPVVGENGNEPTEPDGTCPSGLVLVAPGVCGAHTCNPATEHYEYDGIRAMCCPGADPGDPSSPSNILCSRTWCHLGNLLHCKRFTDGTFTNSDNLGDCPLGTPENHTETGANLCQRVNCGR